MNQINLRENMDLKIAESTRLRKEAKLKELIKLLDYDLYKDLFINEYDKDFIDSLLTFIK